MFNKPKSAKTQPTDKKDSLPKAAKTTVNQRQIAAGTPVIKLEKPPAETLKAAPKTPASKSTLSVQKEMAMTEEQVRKTQKEEEVSRNLKEAGTQPRTAEKSPPQVQEQPTEQLVSARAPAIYLSCSLVEQDQNFVQKWYHVPWPSIGLAVCLCVSVLDPSQVDLLAEYTRAFGGLYFLLVYVVLVWLVQMPLTFLFVHWGQYSQVGLTKLTYLFGQMFRGVGYAMLVWHVVNQGLLLRAASEKLDHAFSLRPHLQEFVQCNMRDLDCQTNADLSFCCDSLKERMTCRRDRQHAMCPTEVPIEMFDRSHAAEESQKIAHYHGVMKSANDRLRRASPYFFWKSHALLDDHEFGNFTSIIMTVVVLLCVALASAGSTVFSVGFTCLGVATVVTILITCCMIISDGVFYQGLHRIVRLSQPERLFSSKVLFALFSVVIFPVNLKFFIASISSFRRKRSEAFTTAVAMTMFHLFVSLFFLCTNMAMTGRLEVDQKEFRAATSLTSVANQGLKLRKDYWQNFVPEYFGIYDGHQLYLWFSLCHFALHVIPVLGPFFSLSELKRFHAVPLPRQMVNVLGACLLGGAVLLVAALAQVYPNIEGRFHGLGHCVGGGLLLLFNLISVHLYGSSEFYIDLCFLYPITKTFHDKYGPISKFFGVILRIVCPLVILLLSVTQFHLNFFFDLQPTDRMGEALEMIIPILPTFTLFVFLGLDVGKLLYMCRKSTRRAEVWKMFYPTAYHPSYKRIINAFEKKSEREQSTTSH